MEEEAYEPAVKKLNGTYHCEYHKKSFKCDVCSHMSESRTVLSSNVNVNHTVAGHNVNLPATQKLKN